MINFWRLKNGLLAFCFAVQDGEDGDRRQRVQRFRKWLHIEYLKAIIGVPISYLATWFLVINTLPGYSLHELLNSYSVLPPAGLVVGFPFMASGLLLVLAAGTYTFLFALFGIGWLQIKFFHFSR